MVSATEVNYSVRLEALSVLSVYIVDTITTRLTEYLSYQNTGYNDNISPSKIFDFIRPLSGNNVNVYLSYSRHYSTLSGSVSFPLVPVRGTIQVKQSSRLVGWDTESYLYCASLNSSISTVGLLKLADLYIQTTSGFKVYSSDFYMMSNNSDYIQLRGCSQVLKHEGRCLIKTQDSLVELDYLDYFGNGDFSI